MGFQKYKADQLFDGYRMLDQDHVLVTRQDGTVEEIISAKDAGDDIRVLEGILSPGFINCHCHLELSHMKGAIAEGTGLVDFVTRVMRDRHWPDAEIVEAIARAEDEMLANGIVAVGDICNNKLALPQKIKGRIWYHNFIEASGFLPELAELRFRRAVEIYNAYAANYSIPIASNSIVPHAPYSVSDELWQLIARFPGNRLMTMHNQETEDENLLFESKQGGFLPFYERFRIDPGFFQPTGTSSLQACLGKFLPNQQVILVHNVYTSENDLAFCEQQGGTRKLFWCLCPNANLYISGHLPNIEILTNRGAAIVLGTDSLASNKGLNILTEMRTIRQHFPFVRTEKLYEWATLNGAKALQMDHILGSFEPGKKPGVVLSDAALTNARRLL